MSIVLLAALGPPLPAAQFTVCVGAVRLHVGPTARTCSPQSPLPAGPSRGTCSGLLSPDIPPCQRLSRSSSPTSFFPASLPPRPGSLRCRETSSSFPRDTTRTRCFPDSDVLSLSTTKHWEAKPRQPCRAPGTRTRSLLSRWLRERAVAILCSAASNSLVRLCRSSPTVPSQKLFTRPWLRLGRVHLDSPWTGEWE